MVVVVIIGVLVAIAIPIYNNVTANAERNACHASQRTIAGAIQMAAADDDPASTWQDYMDGNPECPTNNTPFPAAWVRTDGCPDATNIHGAFGS